MMPRPIFLLILNALYKGFQMRYHLFKKLFEKVVKIKETSFRLSGPVRVNQAVGEEHFEEKNFNFKV